MPTHDLSHYEREDRGHCARIVVRLHVPEALNHFFGVAVAEPFIFGLATVVAAVPLPGFEPTLDAKLGDRLRINGGLYAIQRRPYDRDHLQLAAVTP